MPDDHAVPSSFAPERDEFPSPDVPFARPLAWASGTDPFFLLNISRGAAWADLAIIAAAMITLELLTSLGLQAWLTWSGHSVPAQDMPPELMQRVLGPIITIRALATCIIAALLVKLRGLSAASVGLKIRTAFVDFLLGVAATPVAYLVIIMTILLVGLAWGNIFKDMTRNAQQLTDLIPALSTAAFFFVALIIGIYEEILFRGLLMTRLRRASGSWIVAVVVTSAVFTVLHAFEQTKGALITIAALSLFFSVLTVWRRSIVPAIVAHALFDFSQFLLLRYGEVAAPALVPA